MVDNINFQIPEVQFKIAIISSLPTSWDNSCGCILVSKRVTTVTLRYMPHPRNSLEYSRRNTCDDCDILGNLQSKKWSTKLML